MNNQNNEAAQREKKMSSQSKLQHMEICDLMTEN